MKTESYLATYMIHINTLVCVIDLLPSNLLYAFGLIVLVSKHNSNRTYWAISGTLHVQSTKLH